MKSSPNSVEKNINLNYYSRQIGAFGLDTMMKLTELNVFIYGMRGVGFEVAKNLILTGPKRVTIFDDNISKINDLSSNIFYTEEDVKNNKRRDFSCLKKSKTSSTYSCKKINHFIFGSFRIRKRNFLWKRQNSF